MNIALAHFKSKGVDGVSLEMEKFKTILERLGHKVCFIAGNKAEDTFFINELNYLNPRNNRIVKNAYEALTDFSDETDFQNEILDYAYQIEKKLTTVFIENQIDVIIPSNIFSLGWNLSAAIAIYNACIKTNKRLICHHHDFWWERKKYSKPTSHIINEILEKYFPPKHPLISHLVINTKAQKALYNKKGVESKVVPNVFDFESERFEIDSYNNDLRKKIGIKKNDVVFLQATRIIERKGIELAMDVVSYIDKQKDRLVGRKLYNNEVFTKNSSIYFILSNLSESRKYYDKLMQYAKKKQLKLIDINNIITYKRTTENSEKKYSFWDAYAIADIVTYPSILEGWGNQFIEAIFALKPIIIYEYPVFKTDIKHYGFNIISLGNHFKLRADGLKEVSFEMIREAAKTTIKYLTDSDFRIKKTVDNFEIGKKNFSYQSLENILKKIF